MKKKLVLTILLLLGISNAQYGFINTGDLNHTETPDLLPFGTISIEPLRTTFSFGSDDSSNYYGYAIFNNIRFSIFDFLDGEISFPFYIDRLTRNSLNYRSSGRGDILLNIKYNLPISNQFSLAISPYFSLPFGRTRVEPIDSMSPDTFFEGGILRDYTSTSYDYGVKFIGGYKSGQIGFNLNYGYYSAYRHQLSRSSPDFHLLAASITYNYGKFTPYGELLLGFYSNKSFGKAPSYLSLGTKAEIFNYVDFNFGFSIPLVSRAPISAVESDVQTDYPGFVGSFPNYPENIVFNFGVNIKNIVYNRRSTSRVTFVIKDKTTQSLLDNYCKVRIGAREYYTNTGVLVIPAVRAGMYNLSINADNYMELNKVVEIQGGSPTRIEVYLLRKSIPVVLRVRNTRFENLSSAIAIFSVEEGSNTSMADANGIISYEIDRTKPISVYVTASGYTSENIYLDPPAERDSIFVDIILKEEGDVIRTVLPIIYFDVNSYRIKKEYFPFLDIVGRYLVTHPNFSLEIVGHASGEGPERFNQVLSIRRAEECKKHLVMRYRLDPERIIVKGFGKEVPAVPNKTEYQRSINRRVEFRLIPPEK